MGTKSYGSSDEVRSVGRVWAIPVSPYWEVVDRDDASIPSVARYLQDFWARGMSLSSVESYARDLLRWFRFLWVGDREWNRVTSDDVRDFVLSLREVAKRPAESRRSGPAVNEVSGKSRLAATACSSPGVDGSNTRRSLSMDQV